MLTATVDFSALHLSHYERTAYADRIKLTPASRKGLLMQLVLRQGSHRESWASIGFMAERVGCAMSTARQALRVLEDLGLVITTPGDNCETSGYRIDDQQLIAAGGGGGLVGRPARRKPVPPPPETGA